MKKTRKVLLAVLSVLMLASLSLGVASCQSGNDSSSVIEDSSHQVTDGKDGIDGKDGQDGKDDFFSLP